MQASRQVPEQEQELPLVLELEQPIMALVLATEPLVPPFATQALPIEASVPPIMFCSARLAWLPSSSF